MNDAASDCHAQAARLLGTHPDYRVQRRLGPVTHFHAASPEASSRIGVAIDVETTGLDRETDRIIELAIQRFRFDERGRIIQVGVPRVWREDPGMPIDPQITSLTGLTDADVAEQQIDESVAIDILSSANLIVAHNAAFDRPFVDRRLPAIAGKPWACSMVELDWLGLGFEGRALAHLVSQCGWFYEGHRAQNDILALLYLLSHGLPDRETILAKLIACSEQQTYRVNAIDAPFDAKDRLKSRGYRWDATMRFWWRSVGKQDRDAESAPSSPSRLVSGIAELACCHAAQQSSSGNNGTAGGRPGSTTFASNVATVSHSTRQSTRAALPSNRTMPAP